MKTILVTLAMLVGGSAFAGEPIAPPVTKYVENVPLPPRRPTNFGKVDTKKVDEKIQEVTSKK